MIHEPELLDRLEALPKETFEGHVFRATRQSLDPLASSISGGRWMPKGGAGVLYTSLEREGALAEISFHWSQQNPLPSKPLMLHTLGVTTNRTLKLVRADLTVLGVPEHLYTTVNLVRTQQIGAAIDFLGCDGLIAPSARWDCDNLVLFPDSMGDRASLELISSESVDWISWATKEGFIK